MNAEPHVHDLTVYDGSDFLHVKYGDQKILISKRLPFLERRLRRTAKRIVRRHDSESQKAGERAAFVASVRSEWAGQTVTSRTR